MIGSATRLTSAASHTRCRDRADACCIAIVASSAISRKQVALATISRIERLVSMVRLPLALSGVPDGLAQPVDVGIAQVRVRQAEQGSDGLLGRAGEVG